MNQKLFAATISLALAALCGCESARYEPAEALATGQVRTAPPELTLNEIQILERAAAQPPSPVPGDGWKPLFDGRSLAGWRVVDYGDLAHVEARSGMILLRRGGPFTGISWSNTVPVTDYEISLEAMRVSGSDFFCGLTFPVRDSFCSLIVGGWGGTLVGISNLDGADASENETTQFVSIDNGRWYRIRLRVTAQKLEAWVEQKKVVNVTTTGRKLSLRFGDIELSKPLGITSWDTGAALREIKWRPVTQPDSPSE
jgi:Domain of Unknown Function (DUF1080)